MQQVWNQIKKSVNEIDQDFDNVLKGNNSAGTRVRALLQEIKKDAHRLRSSIQEDKNQRAEAKRSKG